MSILEKIANIALILTCTVVVGEVAYQHLRPTQSKQAYAAGDRIKDTPSAGFQRADRTLLMVTASSCRFCVQSAPFYRELTAAAQKAHVRVLGVTFEPVPANERFLSTNGITVERVISAKENALKPTPTPTLILVRRDGAVVRSWTGELNEKQQRQVLGALGAA